MERDEQAGLYFCTRLVSGARIFNKAFERLHYCHPTRTSQMTLEERIAREEDRRRREAEEARGPEGCLSSENESGLSVYVFHVFRDPVLSWVVFRFFPPFWCLQLLDTF